MARLASTLASAATSFLLASTVLHSRGVCGWSIAKRDSSSNVPPEQTLDMPLMFDSQGRYVLPVQMGSGSSPQTFNFTLTTGTGLTYVAASGCSTCSNTATYDQASSSSAVSLSGSDNTTFFGQSISGSLIKEDCGAKLGNGSFWQYPNQTVATVTEQNQPILSNGISGIFGLGTNEAPSSSSSPIGFNDSIYGQWFPRNPGHDNFTFGMALQPSGSSSPSDGSSAGVIHWLQPNPAFYKPNQVSWANLSGSVEASTSSNGSSTTPAQDWTVGLDGWAATVGATQLSNTQSVVATVDPMFPNIYLPADQAKIIHDAINGSSTAPSNFSTLDGASQAFIIPCDTQYTFGLVVGGQTFVVDTSSLIIQQGNNICVSGIEGFTDTSQTSYLIGARFISTVYLIFNIPRNGSPTLGISPRVNPSHSSTNVGAIVGGTVGGVALVVVCGLIVYWYLRRRANRQRGTFEIDDPDKPPQPMHHAPGVEPFMLGHPTALQMRPTPPTSPVPSQPLLLDDENGHQGAGVPPPSYEEASSSAGTPVSTRPPRDFKGRARPYSRAVSALSESTTTNTSSF